MQQDTLDIPMSEWRRPEGHADGQHLEGKPLSSSWRYEISPRSAGSDVVPRCSAWPRSSSSYCEQQHRKERCKILLQVVFCSVSYRQI